MKAISGIIGLVLLSSCFLNPAHINEAHRVSKYGKIQGQRQDLYLIGEGGSMMGDIKNFSFSFTTERRLAIKEARQIIVAEVQSLLNFINSDQRLCQHLHEYPFTEKDIEYDIICWDNRIVNPPYLAGVTLMEGNIFYQNFYPNNELGKRYQVIHEESYQEALEIVTSQCGDSLEINSLKFKGSSIYSHESNVPDCSDIIEKIGAKYQMKKGGLRDLQGTCNETFDPNGFIKEKRN